MATPALHSNREIQVFPDVNAIAARAAELILAAANAAVQQNGRFTIALDMPYDRETTTITIDRPERFNSLAVRTAQEFRRAGLPRRAWPAL